MFLRSELSPYANSEGNSVILATELGNRFEMFNICRPGTRFGTWYILKPSPDGSPLPRMLSML